jgi:hypothetical protein
MVSVFVRSLPLSLLHFRVRFWREQAAIIDLHKLVNAILGIPGRRIKELPNVEPERH